MKEEYDTKIPDDRRIPCPVCGMIFLLPKAGVEALPSNIFVETGDLPTMCDVCTLMENIEIGVTEAVAYCVECQQNYCAECTRLHVKMISSKDHKPVRIGELKPEDWVTSMKRCCNDHPTNEVELCCQDCNFLGCSECLDKHPRHKCCAIEDIVTESEEKLKGASEKMSMMKNTVNCRLEDIKTKLKLLSAKKNSTQKAILQRGDDLKNKIEEHAKNLAKGSEKLISYEIEDLKRKKEELEEQLKAIESSEKLTEKVLGELPKQTKLSYLIHIARTISTRIEEQAKVEETSDSKGVPTIEFIASAVPSMDYELENNLIGSVYGI